MSSDAHLEPTAKQLLRAQGKQLLDEIIAIDEQIGGLQMTSK
jgi:hypothetical protein